MLRGKVLVVDDERCIRETLRMMLEEYEVVTAENGEKALSLLRRPHDIDAAIVDIMLPGIRGLELLHEIKYIAPGMRVAICTGYGTKDIILEAFRQHADDFLEKPFDNRVVLEVVQRLVPDTPCAESGGKVGAAMRLVQKNFAGPLSLQEVAGQLCLHPKYLSRVFREKTGIGFSEYKCGLRHAMAKQLLGSTALPVCTIAYRLGYQNPDSFMKAFKRREQCTPSEYRLSLK